MIIKLKTNWRSNFFLLLFGMFLGCVISLLIVNMFLFNKIKELDNDLYVVPVHENLYPGTEREFAGIVFCWIPPGSFMMGSPEDEQNRSNSEGPQRIVTFQDGFWMSKYPITQAQWQAIMGNNPSHFKGDNRPVERVSWNDIRGSGGYLEQLNEAYSGYNFRLPSEAEWEYTYRAGTTTRFYWSDDPNHTQIDDYAWYEGNNTPSGTKDVGLKLPNDWGLYDMAGNVFEWCEDTWHENYIGAPNDGGAWEDNRRGGLRILRGGTWFSNPNNCRAANRYNISSVSGFNYVGLRLVCDMD